MAFNLQATTSEMDICALLQSMNLDTVERREWENASDSTNLPRAVLDEQSMMEDPNYQSDEGSECSGPSMSTLAPALTRTEQYGCAYLQMLRSQIEDYPTTGGEYVEAIFTHREVFSAHPAGHRECARGFTDIAGVLEKRAWRADREADTEAVSAVRYEAWMIANSLTSERSEAATIRERLMLTFPVNTGEKLKRDLQSQHLARCLQWNINLRSTDATWDNTMRIRVEQKAPGMHNSRNAGREAFGRDLLHLHCQPWEKISEMSAYGDIRRPQHASAILPVTAWSATGGDVAVYHLRLSSALEITGLVDYMHTVFSKVVEEGMTYPQEGDMDKDAFVSYFFAEDVFVGVSLPTTRETLATLGIVGLKGGRSWEETIAGFYYIKPNYPGRSSHICNGGFVVPSVNQGKGYGKALGQSYLHYAPTLGYRGSVFNLVYVNNVPSVKIWESLGFTKAGRIPSAGRLRVKGGDGEEYVDAWIFYKDFLN